MALRDSYDIDALLREFRKIGRDSEYYPESENSVTLEQKAQCVPLNGNSTDWDKVYHKFLLTECYPESEVSVTLEQKTQPVPSNGNSTDWDKFYHEYLLTCHWSAIQNLAAKPVQPTQPQLTQNVWICQFCRNNGESAAFYRTHRLKDENHRVCCPVLRKYVCPICYATGDFAHTLKYCPYNADRPSVPLITRLKGLRNSMGKRRGKFCSS